jgi:hypothetical protein
MNGFDSLETKERHESALKATKISDMTRHDIQRSIARAQQLRAEQFAEWGRKVAQTWGSVFRRPGRLLPTHTRSRDRLVNATQL